MASILPPAVSVIIPAYNRAHCLSAAIDSALAQSFRDIEVLVVDDGSSDATADVIARYNDPRLRSIRHSANLGAAAARNTGISETSGRLVAFLDSDDTWAPEKLAKQVAALDAASSDDCVCCTGVVLHLLHHGVTRNQPLRDTGDWAARIAVGCDLNPGATQLTRREAFARIGLLDETLPRFEDWDWLFRYTRTGGIVVVSEPLAHVYNQRGRLGDVVARSAELYLRKHGAALQLLPGAIRRKAISDLWLQVVAAYGFEGDLLRAVRPFWRAFRVRPLACVLRGVRGIFYVMRGALKRASQAGTMDAAL